MDGKVVAAVKIYGQYLDGDSPRMDTTVINAIRTIREYIHLRDPDDPEFHQTILTAKRKKMSGAELESLVRQYPPPRDPVG